MNQKEIDALKMKFASMTKVPAGFKFDKAATWAKLSAGLEAENKREEKEYSKKIRVYIIGGLLVCGLLAGIVGLLVPDAETLTVVATSRRTTVLFSDTLTRAKTATRDVTSLSVGETPNGTAATGDVTNVLVGATPTRATATRTAGLVGETPMGPAESVRGNEPGLLEPERVDAAPAAAVSTLAKKAQQDSNAVNVMADIRPPVARVKKLRMMHFNDILTNEQEDESQAPPGRKGTVVLILDMRFKPPGQ